jgi:hypothetical protein
MPDRLFAVVPTPQQRPPRGATLLRSANPVVDGPEVGDRWIAGLSYVPEACGHGRIVQAAGYCGSGFAGFPDADGFGLGDQLDYVPPYVAVAQECSAMGGERELAAVEDRARRLLESCATVGIARELWRGEIARDPDGPGGGDSTDLPNNYLANAASYDDLGDGGDFSMLDGLAALEEGLAGCSCGGAGMIHTTSQVVTYWQHLNLLERQPDGRLLTALGSTVVADPGYDGSGAGGAAPDADGSSSWAYATGMVDVRLGPVDVLADRGQIRARNDFLVYAFRPFAATFDPCCHLAAQLDHTSLT